jgi:hypothetical protein
MREALVALAETEAPRNMVKVPRARTSAGVPRASMVLGAA